MDKLNNIQDQIKSYIDDKNIKVDENHQIPKPKKNELSIEQKNKILDNTNKDNQTMADELGIDICVLKQFISNASRPTRTNNLHTIRTIEEEL